MNDGRPHPVTLPTPTVSISFIPPLLAPFSPLSAPSNLFGRPIYKLVLKNHALRRFSARQHNKIIEPKRSISKFERQNDIERRDWTISVCYSMH